MTQLSKPVAFSKELLSLSGLLYLGLLFAAGFLTNFLPLGPINTGTVALYIVGAFLSLAGILYLFNPLSKHIAISLYVTLALIVLVLIKSALDTNPIDQRMHELSIFIPGAAPLFFFIQINQPEIRRQFFMLLAAGLFFLSVFAIFQGILSQQLPLSLFVLRGDATFAVGEDNTLRPTGLIGDPIIFSSILVFASAYFAALWLEKKKFRYLIALLCSIVANYLTYTRASLVLVIPVLIAVWLICQRFHIKHKFAVFSVSLLIVAGIAGLYFLGSSKELTITNRLSNADAATIASTADHVIQIQNSYNAIVAHPFAGVGMGSQGDFVGPQNVLVTDGAWWRLFLEFGIPLSLLCVLGLCIVLTFVTREVLRSDAQDRALAVAFLSYHAYIVPASFVNSALFGHISFLLYWVLLGLSIAGVRSKSSRAFRQCPYPSECTR